MHILYILKYMWKYKFVISLFVNRDNVIFGKIQPMVYWLKCFWVKPLFNHCTVHMYLLFADIFREMNSWCQVATTEQITLIQSAHFISGSVTLPSIFFGKKVKLYRAENKPITYSTLEWRSLPPLNYIHYDHTMEVVNGGSSSKSVVSCSGI